MVTHAPAPHDWKRLGAYLRDARINRGITREFTAMWLRIDRPTIASIEEGDARPSALILAAMETALGLSPGSTFAVLAGQTADTHLATIVDPTQLPTLCGHGPSCD